MCSRYYRFVMVVLLLSLLSACANIVPLGGGSMDRTAPKLLHLSPGDSLLNTRLTRLELKFDEFITVSDVAKELQVSPSLAKSANLTAKNRTALLEIEDSLLQDNTTYTIRLGKSIKDIHEANPYQSAPIIFSTGAWFDSLRLQGTVRDASAGGLDSSAIVLILLYAGTDSLEVISRKKPLYTAFSDAKGRFSIDGLPDKPFRVFALKDKNGSLTFDDDEEWVAFCDTIFRPLRDSMDIVLSLFKEAADTAASKTDSVRVAKPGLGKPGKAGSSTNGVPPLDPGKFTYIVMADTSRPDKRTQEITAPLDIFFSRKTDTFDQDKMILSKDSAGIEVQEKIKIVRDTGAKKISISVAWTGNTLYTLRLLKGFALEDSTKDQAMPSKSIFRTKSEDDYGKLVVNFPPKYVSGQYLVLLKRDNEKVFLGPADKYKMEFRQLLPGQYSLLLIRDLDANGDWTTGELKSRRQPEPVFPYPETIRMKEGWEYIVDFEKQENKQ